MAKTRRSSKRSVPSDGPTGASKRRQPTTTTTGAAPDGDGGSSDLFVRIGEDAHRHILSFALGVRPRPKHHMGAYGCYAREQAVQAERELNVDLTYEKIFEQWQALTDEEKAPYTEMTEKDRVRYQKQTEEQKVWGPGGLAKSRLDFSLVSPLWKDVVGDAVNLKAPEITTPRDLAKLKSRIATLDLDSVRKNFIKDVKKEWGDLDWTSMTDGCDCENCAARRSDMDDASPLETVIDRFGGSYESFSKIVATEYSKFLLVKSIETLVANKVYADESPTVLAWKERCQPSKIVDKMWHCHMLSPTKYASDCITLTGEVIDHDAGYVSPKAHKGSDFGSKKESLYSFEKQFPSEQYYGCTKLSDFDEYNALELFGENFSVLHAAQNIWDDMNEAEECG